MQLFALLVIAVLIGVGIWQVVKYTNKKSQSRALAQAQAQAQPQIQPGIIYMSDAQAAVWASAFDDLIIGTSLSKSVAASQVMAPLMNMSMTPAQTVKYKRDPPVYNHSGLPTDSIRKVITARMNTPQETIDKVH